MADPKTQIFAPPKNIRFPDTVKNLAGWWAHPLPEVGSSVGYLDRTISGVDMASKAGCRGQSYTSWASLSRTYVTGLTHEVVGRGVRELRIQGDAREDWGDIPTREELSRMDKPGRVAIKDGRMKFVRALGYAVTHQAYLQHQRRAMRAQQDRAAPARDNMLQRQERVDGAPHPDPAPVEEQPPFTYSDMIPRICSDVGNVMYYD